MVLFEQTQRQVDLSDAVRNQASDSSLGAGEGGRVSVTGGPRGRHLWRCSHGCVRFLRIHCATHSPHETILTLNRIPHPTTLEILIDEI